MVIKCGRITNAANKGVVVSYGKPPNSNGPSGNGYSVLLANQSLEPNWTMGQNIDDALRVHTTFIRNNVQSNITWKIYNADWKVYVYVAKASADADDENFEPVGYIDVVIGEDQFFLWVGSESIAIVNDVYALANPNDKNQRARFFVITGWGEFTASDDPAILRKCIN